MKSILIALLLVAIAAAQAPVASLLYDNTQIGFQVPKGGINAVYVNVPTTSPYSSYCASGSLSVRFYVSFDNFIPQRVLNAYYSFDSSMTGTTFLFNVTSFPTYLVSYTVSIPTAKCGGSVYLWINGACPYESCINSISVHVGAEFDYNLVPIYSPSLPASYPALVPPYMTLNYPFNSSYWGYFTYYTSQVLVYPVYYTTTLGFLSSVQLLGKNGVVPTLQSNDWLVTSVPTNETFNVGYTYVAFYAPKSLTNVGNYSICMCSAASASTVSILLAIVAILALLL